MNDKIQAMSSLRTVFVCSLLFASAAEAQTNAERYALQERCGKQAAAAFKNEWGGNITNTIKGQIVANYQNHYSERLNKCFYLETSTTYEKANGKVESLRVMRLYDINENKEYGMYGVGQCVVDDALCRSEQEFLQLIKKYMEN
jgi:hypothetical protein